MGVVHVIVILLRALLLPRVTLAAEDLALRWQFGVLRQFGEASVSAAA